MCGGAEGRREGGGGKKSQEAEKIEKLVVNLVQRPGNRRGGVGSPGPLNVNPVKRELFVGW